MQALHQVFDHVAAEVEYIQQQPFVKYMAATGPGAPGGAGRKALTPSYFGLKLLRTAVAERDASFLTNEGGVALLSAVAAKVQLQQKRIERAVAICCSEEERKQVAILKQQWEAEMLAQQQLQGVDGGGGQGTSSPAPNISAISSSPPPLASIGSNPNASSTYAMIEQPKSSTGPLPPAPLNPKMVFGKASCTLPRREDKHLLGLALAAKQLPFETALKSYNTANGIVHVPTNQQLQQSQQQTNTKPNKKKVAQTGAAKSKGEMLFGKDKDAAAAAVSHPPFNHAAFEAELFHNPIPVVSSLGAKKRQEAAAKVLYGHFMQSLFELGQLQVPAPNAVQQHLAKERRKKSLASFGTGLSKNATSTLSSASTALPAVEAVATPLGNQLEHNSTQHMSTTAAMPKNTLLAQLASLSPSYAIQQFLLSRGSQNTSNNSPAHKRSTAAANSQSRGSPLEAFDAARDISTAAPNHNARARSTVDSLSYNANSRSGNKKKSDAFSMPSDAPLVAVIITDASTDQDSAALNATADKVENIPGSNISKAAATSADNSFVSSLPHVKLNDVWRVLNEALISPEGGLKWATVPAINPVIRREYLVLTNVWPSEIMNAAKKSAANDKRGAPGDKFFNGSQQPPIRAEHLVAADGCPIAAFEAAGEREIAALLKLFDVKGDEETDVTNSEGHRSPASQPPIRLTYLLAHLKAIEELFEFFVSNTPPIVLERLPIYRCQWEITYRKYLLIVMEVAVRHIIHPSQSDAWADYHNPWLDAAAKEAEESVSADASRSPNFTALTSTIASLTALFNNQGPLKSALKPDTNTYSAAKSTADSVEPSAAASHHPGNKSPTASFFGYSASRNEDMGTTNIGDQMEISTGPSPLEVLMTAGHAVPTILLELLKEAIAFFGAGADTAFNDNETTQMPTNPGLQPNSYGIPSSPSFATATFTSQMIAPSSHAASPYTNTLLRTTIGSLAPQALPTMAALTTNTTGASLPPASLPQRLSFNHTANNGWVPDSGLLLFAPKLSIRTPLAARASRSSFAAGGVTNAFGSVTTWGFGGAAQGVGALHIEVMGMASATERYQHHGPQSPGAGPQSPIHFLPQVPMAASVSVGPHSTQPQQQSSSTAGGGRSPRSLAPTAAAPQARGVTILQGLYQTLSGGGGGGGGGYYSNPNNNQSYAGTYASSIYNDKSHLSYHPLTVASASTVSASGASTSAVEGYGSSPYSPVIDAEGLRTMMDSPPPFGAVLEAAAVALDRLAHCVPPPLPPHDDDGEDDTAAAPEAPHWGNRLLFLRYLEHQMKLMAGSWRMFTMMQRLGVSIRYSAAGLIGGSSHPAAAASPTNGGRFNLTMNATNFDPSQAAADSGPDSPFLTGREHPSSTLHSPTVSGGHTMPTGMRPLEATSSSAAPTSGSRHETPVRGATLPSPRGIGGQTQRPAGGSSPPIPSTSPSPTSVAFQQTATSISITHSSPSITRRIDNTSSKALHAWALLLEAGDERLVGCMAAAMKSAIAKHAEAIAALRRQTITAEVASASSKPAVVQQTTGPSKAASNVSDTTNANNALPAAPPIPLPIVTRSLPEFVVDRVAHCFDREEEVKDLLEASAIMAAEEGNGGASAQAQGFGMGVGGANSNPMNATFTGAPKRGVQQPTTTTTTTSSANPSATAGATSNRATKDQQQSHPSHPNSAPAFPLWAENSTKALLSLIELSGSDTVLLEAQQDSVLETIVSALLGVRVADIPIVSAPSPTASGTSASPTGPSVSGTATVTGMMSVPKRDAKPVSTEIGLLKLLKPQGPLALNEPLPLPRRHLLSDQLIRHHDISDMSSYYLLTQLLPRRTLALEAVGWACDSRAPENTTAMLDSETIGHHWTPYRPVSVGGSQPSLAPPVSAQATNNLTNKKPVVAPKAAQPQVASAAVQTSGTPLPAGYIPLWFEDAHHDAQNTNLLAPAASNPAKPTLPLFGAPSPSAAQGGRSPSPAAIDSNQEAADSRPIKSVQQYQKELSVASKVTSSIGPAAAMMGEEGARAILAFLRKQTRRLRELQGRSAGRTRGSSRLGDSNIYNAGSSIDGLVGDINRDTADSPEERQIVAEVFLLLVRLWRANTLRRVLMVPEAE